MALKNKNNTDQAKYYHNSTKHSLESLRNNKHSLNWSTMPEVFKDYENAVKIPLPAFQQQANISTGESIENSRKPVNVLSNEAMSLMDLATILHMTNGATEIKHFPKMTYMFRAAPSAGALYPTVTYILVRNVKGLKPGIYHYNVKEECLHFINTDPDCFKSFSNLVPDAQLIETAPVTFIYSSIFFRSQWKYRDRAYRYCLLDAGHLIVQTILSASAMNYNSVLTGEFDDEKINNLLNFPIDEEAVMAILSIGRTILPFEKKNKVRIFDAAPKEAEDIFLFLHNSTILKSSKEMTNSKAPKLIKSKDMNGSDHSLPSKFQKGDDLFKTILRRRSKRKWLSNPIPEDMFSSVLYYSYGVHNEGFGDLSVGADNILNLYVVVHNIEGIDPGTYYYERKKHDLALIKKGFFNEKSLEMAMNQRFVGNANAVFIMTISGDKMKTNRDYRYACMDAGMLGGRIYLQTTSLGLGSTGVGAYFDDKVSKVIEAGSDEMVIYLVAIGITSHFKTLTSNDVL